MSYRALLPKQRVRPYRILTKSPPQWSCLLPNTAVAVAPLRNLTGDPKQQILVDDLTHHLVIELFRRCRGFSFAWLPGERRWTSNLSMPNPSELRYVVSGSVQRGGPHGILRANIRISDAVTTDYLWAGRQELRCEGFGSIQTEITRQVSQALHILALHEASYRASQSLDAELEVSECFDRANAALKKEMRADLSAEALKWFLAALGRSPRNVEALVGVARACQHLVGNPWWGDPRAVAGAADLGREAVTIALELEPENAFAKYVQGMLYSAAGQLDEAASAFQQALMMDEALAVAHAFGGYNAALLGRAWETLPSIERAMSLESTERRHSVWYFFAGFAELLLGQTHEAVRLLRKSLERNPTYGSAQLFLIAALSVIGPRNEAVILAQSFRQQYTVPPAIAFEQFWLSRGLLPRPFAPRYFHFSRRSKRSAEHPNRSLYPQLGNRASP